MLSPNPYCRSLLALLLCGCVQVACSADDVYTQDASVFGAAGQTSTNADYSLVSSWRQFTQTSVSTGGAYENASGFLTALEADSDSFSIVTCGFTTNSPAAFHLTISTKPSFNYTVQFSDTADVAWHSFQNTNQFVGAYLETNTIPATFTFWDDFTPATSGGTPSSASRFYRVIAFPSPIP